MSPIYRTVLFVVISFSLCVPVLTADLPLAPCQEVELDPQLKGKVNAALQQFIDEQKRAGLVVAVARHGKVVQHEAVGLQDLETKAPMTRETIFRIYSMTKPITSVAAMQLYEQGKLKLDAPVSQYLPEFADLKVVDNPHSQEISTIPCQRPMVVQDLFLHTAGLTYGFFSNTNVDKLYRKTLNSPPPGAVLHDMIEAMGDLPLVYQPGTKWHYSYATDVLGYVVEKVSGLPFDRYLKEQIFDPLGMIDTGFYVPAEDLSRFATNYGPRTEGGLRSIDLPHASKYAKKTTFFSGGGGLVSTASDYMRFCLMLLNKGQLDGQRILKPQTVELMIKNHLPPALMPIAFGIEKRHGVGFGLGFSVRVEQTDWEAASRIGEYGWGGAASTHFWTSPKDGIAVVVLGQYMPYNDEVERALKPIVYDAIQ